jgi:hypothetical protein
LPDVGLQAGSADTGGVRVLLRKLCRGLRLLDCERGLERAIARLS